MRGQFLLAGLCIAALLMPAPPGAVAGLPVASPAQVGLRSDMARDIRRLAQQAIDQQKIPGCVVLVARHGQVAFCEAFGQRQLEPAAEPMTTDTLFDLASITKPMATATSVMHLVERGHVRLRDTVATYLPEFRSNDKDKITVEQLLIHTSGLLPDNALADYEQGWESAYPKICALELLSPPGEKFRYSDVNFLLLGALVQRVSGQPIDAYFAEHVARPLRLASTTFNPSDELCKQAAPTELVDDTWLRGRVHDPRARAMGGVAGHAGLFSTAAEVAQFAQSLLDAHGGDTSGVLQPRTIREMTRPRDAGGNLRGLGWDNNSAYSKNRGELMSPQAFGHGGFTGTVLWIDPELDLVFVFLSNRVHPRGQGEANDVAGRIASVVSAACDLPSSVQPKPAASVEVKLGIDVLVERDFDVLAGRRVGLIANHTSHDRRFEPTAKLLQASKQCELVKLFSPEHGITGTLDQANIASGVDEATGLPVVSLYGATRQPSGDDLNDIDVLVFDIQDIGCRFYTYISTMGLAMEAAAKAGKPFVVLDRPNPLGGEVLEGPARDPQSGSFVAFHDMPLRHGMTIGEIATMINHERQLGCDLHIVEMQGWQRAHYLQDTLLPWTNTSPNMRSVTQALLYPGIGLLETTNVSVGRGTDKPFEWIGAPWLDAQRLATAVNRQSPPGVKLVPTRFTPTASVHRDQPCSGVLFVVTDAAALRSVDLAWMIALELRRAHPDEWECKRFGRLLANQQVEHCVLNLSPRSDIQAICDRDTAAFAVRRQPFLLYP
jgi:uncharacterized protein YbbC (DUF1343 family)/CubicO group peptidase (beta-lactamase class C family)